MPHAIGLVPHRHRLFVLHRTFIGRFGNLIFHFRHLGRGCHDRAHRILFALCLRSIFRLYCCRTVYRIRPAAFRVDGLFCRCDILPVRLLHTFACIRLSDRRTFMRLGCRLACCAAGNLCHTNSIHRRRPSLSA